VTPDGLHAASGIKPHRPRDRISEGRLIGNPREPDEPGGRSPRALDEAVEAFRDRPLEGAPYTYVWLDTLTQKVREAGRIVNFA
jgi:hypothetical protein